MPHQLTELKVNTITKPPGMPIHEVGGDVCVVGAGIAGMSAAIESARLGRDVVLVDGLPALGGQMVNSLIGLFCGAFGNAPEHKQLTRGILDDIFRDLGATGLVAKVISVGLANDTPASASRRNSRHQPSWRFNQHAPVGMSTWEMREWSASHARVEALSWVDRLSVTTTIAPVGLATANRDRGQQPL